MELADLDDAAVAGADARDAAVVVDEIGLALEDVVGLGVAQVLMPADAGARREDDLRVEPAVAEQLLFGDDVVDVCGAAPAAEVLNGADVCLTNHVLALLMIDKPIIARREKIVKRLVFARGM